MQIETTFNKDFMSVRDLTTMAGILEQLIEYQRLMGQEPTPEDEMNFFWRFKNQTSNIHTWREEKESS